MTARQPLGAFPLPAGLMLVPQEGGGAVDAAVGALLAGRLPERWPAAMGAHELAHRGELDAAWQALAGDDPCTLYNRYLLDPGSVDAVDVAARLAPELAPLVDVLRYVTGERDTPPALAGDDPACDVVRALVLAAQATAALSGGRPREALDLLRRASERAARDFAPLAAVLRGNAGTVGYEHGLDRDVARADLTAAADALTDTDLSVGKAELHYQLGVILQEQAAEGAPLQPAMHHYYTALQLVTEDTAPYLWAGAQLNLATAYLSSSMVQASGRLRTGIAIQGIRAALRVFTKDEHPAMWATATLNLANALTYAPSGKQGDNLVEAVELYETVLSVRDRASDPVGRARVLANQGNALAHLGVFDQAKAKLYEARFLFEEQLDHDSALAVRSVLDEIAKRSVRADGGHADGRPALGGAGAIPVRPQAGHVSAG
jgi:tetratricopeptide (TPR) repeat protein